MTRRRRTVAASTLRAAMLAAFPAGTATAEPIRLALFDFDLEDFSAGASATGDAPADTAQLANGAGEVR